MSSPGPSSRGSSELSALIKGFVVLGLLVLVCTGLVRACSCAPGAPTLDRSSLRPIDVGQRLRTAAQTVPFAVRAPALPPDWVSQSSDTPRLPGTTDRAVRVGWVTPDDRFARLVQTSGSEAAAVAGELGDPAARGTVEAAGRTWVVHTGERAEPLWVTDVDGVRLVVTGNATPAALTTLASAALAAPVLPRT